MEYYKTVLQSPLKFKLIKKISIRSISDGAHFLNYKSFIGVLKSKR